MFPYVVGVCSVDIESESVGDISESVGNIGDARLRSYSSSASESSWKRVFNDDILRTIRGPAYHVACSRCKLE